MQLGGGFVLAGLAGEDDDEGETEVVEDGMGDGFGDVGLVGTEGDAAGEVGEAGDGGVEVGEAGGEGGHM